MLVSMSLLLAGLAGSATPARAEHQAAKATASHPGGTMTKEQLHDAMRKLWEDHVEYTRNYIISGLAGLDDAQKCAERLLRNQDDIGNAIKPFYGDQAGSKLTALLRDHILIAAEIVKAARASDHKGVDVGEKKWHANGNDIASFLSGANPHWQKAKLVEMLDKHLAYTTDEVVSRLKQDWSADIQAYDQGHEHMLMFADMLTDGIAQQFPNRVRATLAAAR
jgi:hypothetical protein